MADEDRVVGTHVLALRAALRAGVDPVATFALGELAVEVAATPDALYAILRRPGAGGLAVRLVSPTGAFECAVDPVEGRDGARLRVTAAEGVYEITLRADRHALERMRATVVLTPAAAIVLPAAPRDLVPMGRGDDPFAARGALEATQRKLNAGLLYFRIDEPAFGTVLYLQNWTPLNDYFLATGTRPDGVVGGSWPDIGYARPVPPADREPGDVALAAGAAVTLSDAILVFRHSDPPHERESARRFVQMLGAAYRLLEKPEVAYRDWADRAERTARDLAEAPEATVRHYGHRYVHPYLAGEYPDAMVQMSLLSALHDWGKWRDEPHPLEAELKAGLGRFFDRELGTMRRYLPNVGDDKDADAVDSWYLYHPLLNLGRLALDGDDRARALFEGSLDYAIRAARHFDHRWPVQFKVTDFAVIVDTAEADGRGQTDVGGIYAWVMLQAFELTDDKRYLDEARAAIEAAIGLRFDINYQANLTAWGAAACMRLWRITNRDVYLEQSYVYLASFLHNSVIWQSRLGHARHYETFMGVTCLQDAPYMAIYECFDAFVAFEQYLDDGGPELEPEARMLVGDYCKYALSRAWFYYPDALPEGAVSDTQRENNGHIDRRLSFPVEDLYPDGQPAGQVGQEVYGAGAAFVFATRSTHRIEGAPFHLTCDYLVRGVERTGDRALTVRLDGGEACEANLRLVRLKRRRLTRTRVLTDRGVEVAASGTAADRIDYRLPASGRYILTWD